jgi:hypothetical protein
MRVSRVSEYGFAVDPAELVQSLRGRLGSNQRNRRLSRAGRPGAELSPAKAESDFLKEESQECEKGAEQRVGRLMAFRYSSSGLSGRFQM